MNLASIESNASNLPKPPTCSTRSSSRGTTDALQPCSPISTSMDGPIIWETLRWLWLSSTVSSKAQSSSRSKGNPIAPPKLKPPPQTTNAPNLGRLLDRFGCSTVQFATASLVLLIRSEEHTSELQSLAYL